MPVSVSDVLQLAATSSSPRLSGLDAGPTHQENGRSACSTKAVVSAIRAAAISGEKRAPVMMSNVSSSRPLSAMSRSSVCVIVADARCRWRWQKCSAKFSSIARCNLPRSFRKLHFRYHKGAISRTHC
ncbi:hypothetical protein cgR_0688 [Corynebacterium glutamicum R]|uniref:Uncharacterized protein n=1 Tax=Corynebacterium glutamicum (strain R) TaxID=340322 RepID=A0AB72V8R7_CORGB|nr:hypothetical protein cgR_0688 [Corynebacterium glutamicum R]